jgi:hypothetical protein
MGRYGNKTKKVDPISTIYIMEINKWEGMATKTRKWAICRIVRVPSEWRFFCLFLIDQSIV